MDKKFLEPDNMKILGFDMKSSEKDGQYYIYLNDGTKHRNKDYSSQFPEPKGKIEVAINLGKPEEISYLGIRQDGGTRTAYNGVCPDEEFLINLLNNIR